MAFLFLDGSKRCAHRPEGRTVGAAEQHAWPPVSKSTVPTHRSGGSDDPADLLAFWNREIKKMRKLKMKVEITRESEKDGFEGRHEVRG